MASAKSSTNLSEFDKQVQTLIHQGYPKYGNMKEDKFLKIAGKLKENLSKLTTSTLDLDHGYLPFVIVVKKDVVPTSVAMERVDFDGNSGMINLFPKKPNDFKTITSVTIPDSSIYLLVDIDRGKDTLNVRPNDALESIEKKGRSPLTIDEGIAILTQYPQFLRKNNCFSLLASRSGDQRVPAIWISEQRPRLGWCWAGNPHTWLGSASAKVRLG